MSKVTQGLKQFIDNWDRLLLSSIYRKKVPLQATQRHIIISYKEIPHYTSLIITPLPWASAHRHSDEPLHFARCSQLFLQQSGPRCNTQNCNFHPFESENEITTESASCPFQVIKVVSVQCSSELSNMKNKSLERWTWGMCTSNVQNSPDTMLLYWYFIFVCLLSFTYKCSFRSTCYIYSAAICVYSDLYRHNIPFSGNC